MRIAFDNAHEWRYERVVHWIIRILAAVVAILAVVAVSKSATAAPKHNPRFVVIRTSAAAPPKRVNFSTRRRVTLRRSFTRRSRRVRIRGRWSARRHVIEAARHYGVSARVALAVCYHESGCSCHVRRGRAGEIGPMQVLPATARAMGVSLRGCRNQVRAGVRYLRLALRRGRICHYNSGVGRRCNRMSRRYERMVRRVMRRL